MNTAETEPTLKVIAKMEGRGQARTVALFFPETAANAGCIEVWAPIGQHSEAHMDYYHELRNPTPDEAASAIAQYERHYNVRCQRVMRDSPQLRQRRWTRK